MFADLGKYTKGRMHWHDMNVHINMPHIKSTKLVPKYLRLKQLTGHGEQVMGRSSRAAIVTPENEQT